MEAGWDWGTHEEGVRVHGVVEHRGGGAVHRKGPRLSEGEGDCATAPAGCCLQEHAARKRREAPAVNPQQPACPRPGPKALPARSSCEVGGMLRVGEDEECGRPLQEEVPPASFGAVLRPGFFRAACAVWCQVFHERGRPWR